MLQLHKVGSFRVIRFPNKKENTVFHPFVVTQARCTRCWQTPFTGSFDVFYFNKGGSSQTANVA